MTQPADLAYQVLRLEQQLEAYQKLHAEELGELRQALNACKRQLADLANGPPLDPAPTESVSHERKAQEDRILRRDDA
jgi:hypothetical protein